VEAAARWLEVLLAAHGRKVDGALFAATQLARLTGDRSRDLDESERKAVLETLRGTGGPAAWQRLVTEVVAMEIADEARALGDTLPAGLRLV
jgi:hypothetical protein